MSDKTTVPSEDFSEFENDFDVFADESEQFHKKYKDLPVDPPLASLMPVDIVINDEGKVWIMHKQPLKKRLLWVEYDQDMKKITLVTKGGIVQDLGMQINDTIAKYLRKATSLYIMSASKETKRSFSISPLAVRRDGLLFYGNKIVRNK